MVVDARSFRSVRSLTMHLSPCTILACFFAVAVAQNDTMESIRVDRALPTMRREELPLPQITQELAPLDAPSLAEPEQVRVERAPSGIQKRATIYYICTQNGRQWISYSPCNFNQYDPPVTTRRPTTRPSQCTQQCVYNYDCERTNVRWGCVDGCCRQISGSPSPPVTLPPVNDAPLCGGREMSGGYCPRGVCGQGFVCTRSNLCCRCAEGTSIGPCVNGLCPDNFRCNGNNECCSYTVGK